MARMEGNEPNRVRDDRSGARSAVIRDHSIGRDGAAHGGRVGTDAQEANRVFQAVKQNAWVHVRNGLPFQGSTTDTPPHALPRKGLREGLRPCMPPWVPRAAWPAQSKIFRSERLHADSLGLSAPGSEQCDTHSGETARDRTAHFRDLRRCSYSHRIARGRARGAA